MKWIITVLSILSAVFFGLGLWTSHTAQSGDERADAAIPYLIGVILLVIDFCILVGWALVKP